MQGHGACAVELNFTRCIKVGSVGRVAFFGHCQIGNGFCQRNKAFRHAYKLHRLLAGHCQPQCAGVGQPHIFRGREYQPAAHKARVFAAFKQAGKIVQRRVHIAAAYGLDEGRGQLVMVVAVLVVPDKYFGQRRLDVFKVASVFWQGAHIFHKIEQGAGVTVRYACQQVGHVVGHLQLQVACATSGQLHQLRAAKGPQPQHMQAREQLARYTERRILGGCGKQGELARFHQRQKKVLLGL